MARQSPRTPRLPHAGARGRPTTSGTAPKKPARQVDVTPSHQRFPAKASTQSRAARFFAGVTHGTSFVTLKRHDAPSTPTIARERAP